MPTKPTSSPSEAIRSGRSPAARRNSRTQSGTEAMISEVSPIGTCCSVMKSTEFAPGSSSPISAAEASSARRILRARSPRRQITSPQTISPTRVKRTPAPNSAGIVSPASSIPR